MRLCWVRVDSEIPYKPFERHIRASGVTSQSHGKTRVTSVTRSEYHADLKADLHTNITRQHVLAALTIVLGTSFLFGYNMAVLNQPKSIILDFYNETYISRGTAKSAGTIELLWILTAVAFILGGIAGACLAGWVADRMGRKRLILVSHLFVIVGVALSTFCIHAHSPEMLIIGRVILGVHSGISNIVAPIFLTEIAPFSFRGSFGTLHQLAITAGIFVGSILGLPHILGEETRWPYLFLTELLPMAICLAFIRLFPESPRYLLLTKRKREEAEKSFQFYYQSDKIQADIEELDTEHCDNVTGDQQSAACSVFTLLKSRACWKPLMIGCILQIIQQFSGINSIIFFSHRIFHEAGVPDDQIPFAACGTNLVNVIMTMISVAAIDRFGRRLLLLLPMCIMILDLVLITVSLNLQPSVFWMAYISVICVIIYVISFAVGLGPIPMMVGTELFRQSHRTAAMTVCGIVNWLATFVIAVAFEYLQQRSGTFTFVLFLVLMVLFLVFVCFKVPETKHKTIEEIVHQFSPGSEIDVEEAIDDEIDLKCDEGQARNRRNKEGNSSKEVEPECIELLDKSHGTNAKVV